MSTTIVVNVAAPEAIPALVVVIVAVVVTAAVDSTMRLPLFNKGSEEVGQRLAGFGRLLGGNASVVDDGRFLGADASVVRNDPSGPFG